MKITFIHKPVTICRDEYTEKEYLTKNKIGEISFNKCLYINRSTKMIKYGYDKLCQQDIDELPWIDTSVEELPDILSFNYNSPFEPKYKVSLKHACAIDHNLFPGTTMDNFVDPTLSDISKLLAHHEGYTGKKRTVLIYKLITERVVKGTVQKSDPFTNRLKYELLVSAVTYIQQPHSDLYKEATPWVKIGSGCSSCADIGHEIYRKYIDRYNDLYELYLDDILKGNMVGFVHNYIFYKFDSFQESDCVIHGSIIPNNGIYIDPIDDEGYSVRYTESYVSLIPKNTICYSNGRIFFNGKITHTVETSPEVIKWFTGFGSYNIQTNTPKLWPGADAYHGTHISGHLK